MKKSSLLMIIGSILLLGLFVYPLWNIKLRAPQYPEGLAMDIYINDIQGVKKNDLANIDMMNHYVGMRPIPKPEDMWEFSVFPIVVGGMGALGILLGVLGFAGKVKPNAFLGWLILMGVLGILGMYDFNAWLLDYGSNLDPKAAIRLLDENGNLMTYKPPLMGYQKMLNFDVWSYPATGAYGMFAGMGLIFLAWIVGLKEVKK